MWPARKTPFFIGVAGGTASGKTTVCERCEELRDAECTAHGRPCRGVEPEGQAEQMRGAWAHDSDKAIEDGDMYHVVPP